MHWVSFLARFNAFLVDHLQVTYYNICVEWIWVGERNGNAADCKSVASLGIVGSSPTRPTILYLGVAKRYGAWFGIKRPGVQLTPLRPPQGESGPQTPDCIIKGEEVKLEFACT